MTNSLKSQLELTADASGVEAGVSKAKKSLASLGATAAAEGQKAAAGIDKMGKSAGTSSKDVEQATRRAERAIQSQIALLEAGERGSRKYYESLYGGRGADLEKLQPILEKLDSVAKLSREADHALEKGGKQLSAYGVSAKQTAAALRGVPAQLTDIITGLSSGQAPLTVLIQQGGQLKDMFGGVAPAARALGGALLGLINPYTLLAGAVVGIGAAYNSGSKEADAYAKALILTGNAAGQTVDGLSDMAERIDGVVGTQAAAAAALAEFAANGNIAGSSLERFATVAIRMEKSTGQAVKETVKQFAELGKSPVEAAVKLNESTNFLTESVYKQIRALDAQGRTAEAGSVAQKAFADAMESRLSEIDGRLGTIEKGWRSVKGAAAEAWDAMLNVGRQATLEDQLANAERELANRTSRGALNESPGAIASFEKGNQLLKDRIETMKESQRLAGTVADRQREATERVGARVQFDKEADKYLSQRVLMEREIAKINEIADKAQVSRLERERLIAAIREKYKEPDKTGDAQDAIIAAKIAPLVAAAEAAVNADFEATDKLAKDQIKALVEGSIEERQQILKSIDESYAANDKKLQEEAGFVDGKWVGNLKKVDDAARQLGLTFSSAFEDAIVSGKDFSDVLRGIEQDVIRIAVRETITKPAAAQLTGLFSGLFSGSSGSSVPSADGGGFTGSGSRSGGLDGKGGFMAMLHPQETVIDHTRGQSASSSSYGVPINLTVVNNIDSRTDRREVALLADTASRNAVAQALDKLNRQRRI